MTDRSTDHEPALEGVDRSPEQEPAESPDASDDAERVDHLDLGAGAEEPVGDDNIREGRVGGVMGGPRQQGGEGQGG